jgi:hypothetical protein
LSPRRETTRPSDCDDRQQRELGEHHDRLVRDHGATSAADQEAGYQHGQSADPDGDPGEMNEIERDGKHDPPPGAGVTGEPHGEQDGRRGDHGRGCPPAGKTRVRPASGGQQQMQQRPAGRDQRNQPDERELTEP